MCTAWSTVVTRIIIRVIASVDATGRTGVLARVLNNFGEVRALAVVTIPAQTRADLAGWVVCASFTVVKSAGATAPRGRSLEQLHTRDLELLGMGVTVPVVYDEGLGAARNRDAGGRTG